MMKLLQTLAALFFLASVSYAAMDKVAPGWAAEIRTFLGGSATEWSDETKRADPVGYLQFSQKQLQQQKVQLQTVVKDIRTNVRPLADHVQQTREELAKTNAFLSEGRVTYQQAAFIQAAEGKAGGIKFAGRVYPDIPTFKAQLEVLYQEQKGKQTLLAKAESTQKQLNARYNATSLQLSRVEMALNEIAPKIAIVQAATASNELDKIITDLDQVTEVALEGTDNLTEDYNLIGTTRELLETSDKETFNPNEGFDAEFENFLQAKR